MVNGVFLNRIEANTLVRMLFSRKIKVPPEKVRTLQARLAAAKDVHDRVKILANEAGLETPNVREAGNVNLIAYAEPYDYGGYDKDDGSRGRICISDTFEKLSRSVQDAILAHELGHLTPVNRWMVKIQTALRICSCGFFASGCMTPTESIGVFGIAITGYAMIKFLERRIEYHADEFSAHLLGGEGIIETLNLGKYMRMRSTPSFDARIQRIVRLFSEEE